MTAEPLDVLMPIITASGEEAVVTAWFVDDGQACTEGQLIAEVQGEKIAAEVHAPGAGTIVDRVAIGDPVPQGAPICRIITAVGGAPKAAPAVASSAPPPPERVRVAASPSAKRVARERGIDLTTITGTGPGGRITESDVLAAADAGAPAGMSGLRRVIAENMRRSHADTAPVTLFSTVTFVGDPPSSITAVVVKVAAEVLGDHPELNGTRESDVFTAAERADVCLAIQTDDGLVAPVVRDPAGRSVEDIRDEIADLAGRAADRRLTADDYAGGTFTVSNLGALGVEGFTPIINLPQVAILGVGALRAVPVVRPDDGVAAGHELMLSLTFDHAFVDGAPAAAFLQQMVHALTG